VLGGVLPVALVLILFGVVLLFLFPWGGIVAGLVGLVLVVAYLLGLGRAAERDTA
jgi:hypothetical protein